MKLIPTLALGAVLTLSAGVADAAPWFHGGGRDRDHDHDHDRRPLPPPREEFHHGARIEARAQLRLRQLGYYRGRIDGSFGRSSRKALVHFQHDRRLPVTGRLDGRSLRALGIR